jgi:hypothetical protein
MWTTDSLWFEVAIVSIIFAIGNMIFGVFEERSPRLRKVINYIGTLVLVLALSFYFGRTVAMIVLATAFLPVIYIHGFYLPFKKGINGWTAEPKGKYYEFRGWDKDIFREK